MSAGLDHKYIDLIKGRLKDFKWKSGRLANCKCPFCEHDSTHNKRRGYFVQRGDMFYYTCHNTSTCGSSIKNFLKKLDYALYKAYQRETLQYFGRTVHEVVTEVEHKLHYRAHSEAEKNLKRLPKLSSLDTDHPARVFVEKRRIPNPYHSMLRWCPAFLGWTNENIPGKFTEGALGFDQGRIVIPFFDEENRFFAYQGRNVDNSDPRYITIVLDGNIPLLFGLNRVDFSKSAFAVEGPIDSMFLNNCVALAGSNINALTDVANDSTIVIVYDNEPNKPATKGKLFAAIDKGYKVCVWPKWVKYKDINEMVIAGWEPSYIEDLIKDNSYKGTNAKLRVGVWSQM